MSPVGHRVDPTQRVADLLEEQRVAGGDRRPDDVDAVRRSEEIRLGDPGGQAAVVIAPGVDEDLVVRWVERRTVRSFEDDRRRQRRICLERLGRDGGIVHLPIGRDDRADQRGDDPGDDLRPLGHRARRVDAQVDERPRVPPVVHPVVDQPGVTPGRDPMPNRLEIRLVGDRVLEIREAVALVREQFEERDPEIGRVALDPARVQLRKQIEQHPPEAGVVLRHVVEERLREQPWLARDDVAAVHVDRARGHEREPDRGEVTIEHGDAVDPQRVNREIARPVGNDLQIRRSVRVELAGHRDGLHPDDPGPALDRDARWLGREAEGVRGVGRVSGVRRRHRPNEEDAQDPVVRRVHLDPIDAVQVGACQQHSAPLFGIALAGNDIRFGDRHRLRRPW